MWNGSSFWKRRVLLLDNFSQSPTATVTLSETANNFEAMDIFFKSNDGDQDFTRVLYPKGQIVALFTGRAVPPASFYVKSKSIQINGTSMTTVENTGYITGEANAAAAGQYSVGGGSDKIAVIRVIGYRTLEDL